VWLSLRAVAASHLGLVLIVTLGYILALEGGRTRVHDGFGDDGQNYAKWAQDAWTTLADKKVDPYYVQRVLPSAVIWAVMKYGKIEVDDLSIIRAFVVANVVLVALSALAYSAVAKILRLSERARMFGALAIFGSFGIAKFSVYVPVLTDVWAFAFGFGFLYFYLVRRPLVVAALTFLASFCWPSSLHIGALLLVCMARDDQTLPVERAPLRVNTLIAATAAVGYLVYTHRLLQTSYAPPLTTRPEDWFVNGALAIGGIYVFLAVDRLTDSADLYRIGPWLRVLGRPHPYLAAGVWWLSIHFQHRWSNNTLSTLDSSEFFNATMYLSVARPGVFSLAHALFLGPIIVMLHLRLRGVARRYHEEGSALTGIALVGVLFSLNSETRRLFLIAPLLLPFVIAEIDSLGWSSREWWTFAGLTVFASKVWLTIDPGLVVSPMEWPSQSLFMTVGPWMSWNSYLWQAGLLIAVLPMLQRFARPKDTPLAVVALPVPPANVDQTPPPSSRRAVNEQPRAEA
jgi:hypothetical protein